MISRLAKKPLSVPKDVTVTINDTNVVVKGKKGELTQATSSLVNFEMTDNEIHVTTKVKSIAAKVQSGTAFSLLTNMIKGVSEGFEKTLQLVGVGYRAQVKGSNLELALGFSHPVVFSVPEGIAIQTPSQTEIIVSGIDKQKVGQVAANIRSYREPEPYKGKGIRYKDEVVVIKETKK